MQSIFERLIAWDYKVWFYMNTVWHNSVLDAIVPYLRNPFTWAPLYLFLLMFITINFGRRGWMWCVFFLLTFACSDQLSAHLMKPYFHRIRPCNNPYLMQLVHRLVDCGNGFSFPSSHAANHFALAVFGSLTLSKRIKHIWPVAITWAVLVAYSQVYVGVHFPLDVTAGGIVGIVVGSITGMLFNRFYDLSKPSAKPVPNITSASQ